MISTGGWARLSSEIDMLSYLKISSARLGAWQRNRSVAHSILALTPITELTAKEAATWLDRVRAELVQHVRNTGSDARCGAR